MKTLRARDGSRILQSGGRRAEQSTDDCFSLKAGDQTRAYGGNPRFWITADASRTDPISEPRLVTPTSSNSPTCSSNVKDTGMSPAASACLPTGERQSPASHVKHTSKALPPSRDSDNRSESVTNDGLDGDVSADLKTTIGARTKRESEQSDSSVKSTAPTNGRRNRSLRAGAFRDALSQRVKGTLRRPRDVAGQLDQGFPIRQGLHGGSVAWNDLRYRYGIPTAGSPIAFVSKTDDDSIGHGVADSAATTTGPRSIRRKTTFTSARELARIEAAPALGSRQHHPFEVYQLELSLPEPVQARPESIPPRRTRRASSIDVRSTNRVGSDQPILCTPKRKIPPRPPVAQAMTRGKNWHRSQNVLQHLSWAMIFTALGIFGLILFDEPDIVRPSVNTTSQISRSTPTSIDRHSTENFATAISAEQPISESPTTGVGSITELARAVTKPVHLASAYAFPEFRGLLLPSAEFAVSVGSYPYGLHSDHDGWASGVPAATRAGWLGIGVFDLSLPPNPSSQNSATATRSTTKQASGNARAVYPSGQDGRSKVIPGARREKTLKSASRPSSTPRNQRLISSSNATEAFTGVDDLSHSSGSLVRDSINFLGVADAYGLSRIAFALTEARSDGFARTLPILMAFDVSTLDLFSYNDVQRAPKNFVTENHRPFPRYARRSITGYNMPPRLNVVAIDPENRDYLR